MQLTTNTFTFPTIETDRLLLRLPVKADFDEMYRTARDPGTMSALGQTEEPDEQDSRERLSRQAGGWILDGYSNFTVIEKSSGAYVGGCGVFRSYRGLGEDFDYPECGWILSPEMRGKGYGYEVMSIVLDWFHAHFDAPCTVAMIGCDNVASKALAKKLGYRILRQAEHLGDPVDLLRRDRP